jgi:glucose uptake protein GlcU
MGKRILSVIDYVANGFMAVCLLGALMLGGTFFIGVLFYGDLSLTTRIIFGVIALIAFVLNVLSRRKLTQHDGK